MAGSVEVSRLYGFGAVGLSAIVFILLHVAVIAVGYPGYVSPADRWKWKNIFLSWVHSIAIGLACIFSLCAYAELRADLFDFINPFTYFLVAASTGYFICDVLDIFVSQQVRSNWEVLVHHAWVLVIFFYNISERRYIGYTIVALIVEVNSIFLHLRKLMQMAGVSFGDPTYRAVTVLNLLSFVACRFLFSLTLITYGLVFHQRRMTSFYFWTLAMTMLIMWLVNAGLFYRLVKNDVLRTRRKSSGKAPVAATENNNVMLTMSGDSKQTI